MKRILSLLFLAFSTVVYAQKAPAKFGDIPMEDMTMKVYQLDSSAEAVALVDYGESSIAFTDNKGFQITFERLRRIKILTKEGLKWADFSIPTYHSNNREEKLISIKAVTYNLENNKIVQIKAKDESFMKEKYDENWNVTKITWPNVKEGSIIELSYEIVSDFIFNFHAWEFQTSIPVRWSEYRARIPEYFFYEKYMQGYIPMTLSEQETKNNSFTVRTSYMPGERGAFSQATTTQDKVDYHDNFYRWAIKDAPAFIKEPFITTSRDYIAKINFELSYTNFPMIFTNHGMKQYMGSWADINKMYWEQVEKEITGNNSLKNQVDEIVSGITATDKKVEAIFNYVRQNVLWNEEDRIYPENSAKKTLEEKKGSAAEVNFLLASLLEKAQIKVNPVLISTRDHGFVRESMPISTQFNYVVCLAQVDGKSILLDATDKFLPVGMLPERCLNGRGFMISSQGFQWISLQPIIKTKTIVDANMSFAESGEFKCTLKINKNGYNAADARESYLTNGEKDYVDAFSKGRSWTVSKSEFQNVKDNQLPFVESHDVVIDEHTTEAAGTIYMSPFVMSKIVENPFKQANRIYPVDFGHPFDEVYIAKIAIPAGYVIDEVPKNKVILLPENTARYLYNVSQIGNVLNITSNLSINKGLFTQHEYVHLREFYSQIIAKQAEQIVFKKKQ